MNKEEFEKIITKARYEKRMTQSKLARITGFSRQAVYNWEKAADNISLENADKLLKVLGVEIRIGGNHSD